MSLTTTSIYRDNGELIMVSYEEKEQFDNGEPVYFECTDDECGNSFYLEKEDEI